jgi:hypothetical protein
MPIVTALVYSACADAPPTTAPQVRPTSAARPKVLGAQVVAKRMNQYLHMLDAVHIAQGGLDSTVAARRVQLHSALAQLNADLERAPNANQVIASTTFEPPEVEAAGGFDMSATYTDLSLGNRKVVSYSTATIIALISQSTYGIITVDGTPYAVQGGASCLLRTCLAEDQLHPAIDCRVNAAMGNVSTSHKAEWRVLGFGITIASVTTHDSDSCPQPAQILVTLGNTSVSVGSTVHAQSNCAPTSTTTWASNQPLVASINQDGIITGVNAGTAEISVTCQASRGTAVITVTLADDPPPPPGGGPAPCTLYDYYTYEYDQYGNIYGLTYLGVVCLISGPASTRQNPPYIPATNSSDCTARDVGNLVCGSYSQVLVCDQVYAWQPVYDPETGYNWVQWLPTGQVTNCRMTQGPWIWDDDTYAERYGTTRPRIVVDALMADATAAGGVAVTGPRIVLATGVPMKDNAHAIVVSRASQALPDLILVDENKITEDELEGAYNLALQSYGVSRARDEVRVVTSVQKQPGRAGKPDKGNAMAKALLKDLRKAQKSTVPGLDAIQLKNIRFNFRAK